MPTNRRRKRRAPIPAFTLWLEFELWQPIPELGPDVNKFDPEDDFCNIMITIETGERYALNVWTYNFFARARQGDGQTGDNLRGQYLLPPDLFVARLDRPLLEAVIADLLHADRLLPAWRVVDDDDPPDTASPQP